MSRKRKDNAAPAGEINFGTNLVFTFKYADVVVEFDSSWNDGIHDQKKEDDVRYAVKVLSKEINIDKTYVAFPDSKYEKTMFEEDEWLKLCDLEAQTKYGKSVNEAQHAELIDFYVYMIITYILDALSDLGFDTNGIILYMSDKSQFMLEIRKNPVQKDNYPGKWQTW